MTQIFFASSNRHKIAEFQEIFAAVLPQITLLTLLDWPHLAHEVRETGRTYQENALIKARSYARLTDLPLITDDSGVQVTAFPDLLGVHSARWFPGSDQDRCQQLLYRLRDQPNRQLIYHGAICYLPPDRKKPLFFLGQLPGQAALTPRGTSGFGYDPIMIPDGYHQTISQLTPTQKNAISHRRQAINQLATVLSSSHL